MKHLHRFNENHEYILSNQDIIDFFSEWSDDNPNSVTITDIIINTDKKEVYKPTTYLKDPTKIVKGKMVQLFISKPSGLSLSNMGIMWSCMDNFEDLSSAIEYILRNSIFMLEMRISIIQLVMITEDYISHS